MNKVLKHFRVNTLSQCEEKCKKILIKIGNRRFLNAPLARGGGGGGRADFPNVFLQ